ncbi:MAG: DUF4192 domain-containing protein [Bifidobacteriaceae bacterium]|jgi:hypothetical protein|nr:DUF4192 domain-containing protein [Bifidobacteriaceae bacterium]
MSSVRHIIKKASGLDALALIEGQLGFRPHESVVVCALHPPRGRVHGMVRLDWPAEWHPELRPRLLHGLDLLVQAGGRGSFVVRYAAPGAPSLPDDEPLRCLLKDVGQPMPVAGLWDVSPARLQEYDWRTGRPLGEPVRPDELRNTRVAAAMALEGIAPLARRDQLATIKAAPENARRAARKAERRTLDRAVALNESDLRAWREDCLAVWSHWLAAVQADRTAAVPPTALGRIHALIGHKDGRQAIALSPFKTTGPAFEDAVGAASDVNAELGLDDSPGIDPELAQAALDLVSRLLAHVAPQRRAEGYALGAWWYWWLGSGPHASEWARAALDCDPRHTLAALVDQALDQGSYPRAVVERSSATV